MIEKQLLYEFRGSMRCSLARTLSLVSSFESRGRMFRTLIAPHGVGNHCGLLSMTSCVRKVMEPHPRTRIASSPGASRLHPLAVNSLLECLESDGVDESQSDSAAQCRIV